MSPVIYILFHLDVIFVFNSEGLMKDANKLLDGNCMTQ